MGCKRGRRPRVTIGGQAVSTAAVIRHHEKQASLVAHGQRSSFGYRPWIEPSGICTGHDCTQVAEAEGGAA